MFGASKKLGVQIFLFQWILRLPCVALPRRSRREGIGQLSWTLTYRSPVIASSSSASCGVNGDDPRTVTGMGTVIGGRVLEMREVAGLGDAERERDEVRGEPCAEAALVIPVLQNFDGDLGVGIEAGNLHVCQLQSSTQNSWPGSRGCESSLISFTSRATSQL